MSDDVEPKRDSNNKLMLKLLAFALGSFAFGFALVPFYDVLCDLTGFGNQKALAEARVAIGQPDDSRTITVDFIADLPSVEGVGSALRKQPVGAGQGAVRQHRADG